MANFNKVILLGNITRELDLKYTPKGTAVLDIGLAVNRVYGADTGERREETTFIDITFWGRTAEIVNQYCQKGSPLFVEGRLQLDTWEDKSSGQKRSKLRVVGESIQLIGPRSGGGSEAHGSTGGSSQRGSAPESSGGSPPPDEDDIPF